jgi:Putative metal-binding motif
MYMKVLLAAVVSSLACVPCASAGVTFQTLPSVANSVGMAADRQGNVYVVADYFTTRKVSPAGASTLIPWDIPTEAWDSHLEAQDPVWGPDDKLWLSCRPLVCHIDPDAGDLIDTPPAYGTPGPDGSFWAIDRMTGVVSRATTTGVVTYFSGLPVSSGYPSPVVSGPGDSMWFTYGGALVRVTMGGAVTAMPLPSDLQLDTALAAGPDGNLWASVANGVARISPAGQVLGRYPVTDTPNALAPGPDGDVWFTYHRAGGLGRVTPSGHVTDFAGEIDSRDLPTRIIRASDGAMWANAFNFDKLWRVVPDPPIVITETPTGVGTTGSTLRATVDPNGGPTSVSFEYGATTAYDMRTAAQDAGDGDGGGLVTTAVGGLQPSTTYHYRVLAVNGLRTVRGEDRTLTTAAEPVTSPAPGPVTGAAVDADHDGYPAGVDCDDREASIHPGARDRPGDKVDQDCAGGPARWGHLASPVDARWSAHGKVTRFTRFTIGALPAKTTISLSCRGRGCGFATYQRKTKKAVAHVDLLAHLEDSRLRGGAAVTLRLARAGQATTIIRWTIGRKTRRTTSCLSPGARKPVACS